MHYTENNKALWNSWTDIHVNSEFYDVKSFIQGKSSLNKVELDALGDVRGKSILHLQCHFGLDSISWARLGAQVTAVDFSDKAIDFANNLAKQLKNNREDLDIEFICSDVYLLPEKLRSRQFDIVFTSYGVLVWLNNLYKWANIISKYLKPNGIFYMIEFHPIINMLDDSLTQTRSDCYFASTTPRKTEESGSYVDLDNDTHKHYSYEWYHPISEILNALHVSGLIYENIEEYKYSPYNCFKNLTLENGFYKTANEIPLLFSIKAINYPNFKKE